MKEMEVTTVVEFKVICENCRSSLTENTTVMYSDIEKVNYLLISPCKHCMDEARNEGFIEGS